MADSDSMAEERRPPPRTLSIGGAAYDVFVRIDPAVKDGNILLPVGEKLPIHEEEETCGGGAANTSVGLARLGCTSTFCAVVGDDQWGQRMLETLRKERVDTRCATIIEHENTGFSVILLLPGGERTILHHPGTNERLDDVTFDLDAINDVDAVYLNRLSEGACEIENDIIRVLSARDGTHLTWNPGGCQLRSGMQDPDKAKLLACTDLLLLNKEEALLFTGAAEMKEAMRALLQTGVKTVCVTDGKNGAYAAQGSSFLHCPARRNVTVVDTTGAGDAFGTAMTRTLLFGDTLPNALRAGTLNSASVVGAVGAQTGLLTDTELSSLLETHELPVETSSL